ncbi:hypothetical protein ACGF1Z_28935 [Streptomyces sp. NPDC048018]|uniref:hypothetical protein n=1 Tax=Streptomyces sp. NPDC048018 TaxID=3365499 RepID=UPI00370FC421
MENSRTWAVHRTTDAGEALAAAGRLCALFAELRPEVSLGAELRTVGDVRRMAEVLPEGLYDHLEPRTDPETGEWRCFDADPAATSDEDLAGELPLDVTAEAASGTVETRFVAALGEGQAWIDWQGVWPDPGEREPAGWWSDDGVQVVFHGERAERSAWTARHTVLVHVSTRGDVSRASRLAARLGEALDGAWESRQGERDGGVAFGGAGRPAPGCTA